MIRHKRHQLLFLPLLPLLFTLLTFASPAEDTAHTWLIDDLVLAERAGSWNLAPDGSVAAWTRSTVVRVDGEEKRLTHLWISDLDGKHPARRLTRGTVSDFSPRFSPDGRFLAFLSERELPPDGSKIGDASPTNKAVPQVWLLPLGGGEAFPATRLGRPIRDFDWINGKTLVALAQESPSLYENQLKKGKDTSLQIDDADHEPPVRLFRITLGAEAKRLTSNSDWIDSLTVSPDGRHAVVTAQQSLTAQFDSKVPANTFLVNLETGARTRLFADGVIRPQSVVWKIDSSGFYVTNLLTGHPIYRNAGIMEVHEHDLHRGKTTRVELDWDRGLGSAPVATPDGFVVLLADGVHPRAARYVRSGSWTRQDLVGTHANHLDNLLVSRDGSRLVYLTSAVNRPEQWYVAHLNGSRIAEERQLTRLNPHFKGKNTGRVEVVTWEGARGETVEGLLQYPLDWKEGEKRPLVLDIHGGPWGLDRDRWSESYSSPNLLWRQRGAFVFQVNYHGSAGYGQDWAESIEKHYYELEVPDIEKGVDHLIERGLVDPDRLASTGWSNGGILTAALITESRRYKAAVIGAADVEWISDWANVSFGASFDNYYFGDTPWKIPQVYIDKSPFFRLEDVDTPTIIHTGTKDLNVPPHQSWSLFRAMQYIEKAPVRFLTYPGEPHGLKKVAHQRRKAAEDVAWLDRYLFDTYKAPQDAVKEGSPLDTLLKRSKATRMGGAFGQNMNGVLIPETVHFAGLEVGRFEVTRAQYAAFDGNYEVRRGEENLPMTGLTFERAQAYASWLAKSTSRAFRLPTTKEAERLAKKAGRGGNTLDRWTGYTPNHDDAQSLAALLLSLNPGELLKPVGESAGQGENPVFDLDGNAAEWAQAKGGDGVAVGPSAERSTDSLSSVGASLEYTGLRMLVE